MSEPSRPLRRLRGALDRFIHHPVVELAILVLIVVSVVLMLLEVVFASRPLVREGLELAGYGLTGLFAVELLVRFWVARKKARFFKRYWLDILAVVPLVRPLRFFRVLRLLRIFRAGVLLNRRMSSLQRVFRGTGSELTALAAFTITLVLAASMVLHLSEGRVNAAFPDFEATLWFSIFSIIGGEPIGGWPQSEVGRWVTAVLMLGGLTVFGMFVGTVSASMVARLSRRLEVQEMDLDELQQHVVVCGWNRSAPTVVQELFAPGSPRGRAVVVITEGDAPPVDMPTEGVRPEYLYHLGGDWTRVEVLEKAGIQEASRAILLTDTLSPRSDQDRDARTVLAALTIEKMVPDIFTIAELTSLQGEHILRMSGVEEIVVGDWYAGKIMGSAARSRGLLQVLDDILTAEKGNAFYTMPAPSAWIGRSVGELHAELLERHQAVLVSLRSQGETLVNPPARRAVAQGDKLVYLARERIRP